MDRSVAPAFVLFGASLFLVVTLGFAAQAWSALGGLAFTEIFLILVPAVIFARRLGMPARRALRWTPIRPRIAVLSLALGATTWGVAISIHHAMAPLLGTTASVATQTPSVGIVISALIAGALLPGICEEVLFRGAIQGVLERRGQRYAVVVTAFLFGLFHLAPSTIVPAFFLGLVFGTVMVRTGSAVAAALAHTANNAVAIGIGFILHGAGAGLPVGLVAALGAGFVVTAVLLYRATAEATVGPSPLATMPMDETASAPAVVQRRWLWITGGGVLVLCIALVGLAASLTSIHRVDSGALAPALDAGDLAVVVLDRSRTRPVGVGDVVLFRSADGDPEILGLVRRTEDGRLWIESASGVVEVARSAVAGKVVYPRRSTAE